MGGPAKAAVVASAFQGIVTGSSVANTVGSGSFTIPLMKKTGYRPEFAAAVEALSASTGGQLMPPIMGAAAFLMIEFIGMEYGQIALGGDHPRGALFCWDFIAVHLESKRWGILGLPADQIPRLKEVMLQRGYLLLPLLAIIGVLVMGQSPITAALIAILVAVTVGLFEGGSLKQTLVERWYLLLPLLGLLYLVFSKASLPATWGALGLLFVAFLIHLIPAFPIYLQGLDRRVGRGDPDGPRCDRRLRRRGDYRRCGHPDRPGIESGRRDHRAGRGQS